MNPESEVSRGKEAESRKAEIVSALREVADRIEAGEEDTFIILTGLAFEGEGDKLTSKSYRVLGGSIPGELDPNLVALGCVGDAIRLTRDAVDLSSIDVNKAVELLGMKDIMLSLGGKKKGKIIRG